ncbi:hypothetical protein A3Q56_01069 [Intoshia linei]|uniref:Elongation factor Ts, mitochondrial n=1 Tax=Intoshia linei TaxID=1819745 RepID=A0A177BCG1_9BILA|nr:hypothetical protein A3Q56_01069 [Intoshia linei]
MKYLWFNKYPTIYKSITSNFSTKTNTQSSLSKLRKQTGYSFLHCKNALLKFDGNISEAKKWLDVECMKKGWSKATKLDKKSLSQGIIYAYNTKNVGSLMFELNCETDYVSKNDEFLNLADKISKSLFEFMKNKCTESVHMINKDIKNVMVDDKSVFDSTSSLVGKIGENIFPRRAVFYKHQPENCIKYYIHQTNKSLNLSYGSRICNFASLLRYKTNFKNTSYNEKEIDDIVNTLCQHIVGMNPIGIFPPKIKNEDDLNHKLDSFMINQNYLMDSEITIKELLSETGIELLDFCRYERGELSK